MRLEVHVGRERQRAGMDLQDLRAALAVGRLDRDAAVEAPRAQQCRVQDLGAVRGAQHDHVRAGLEPVHLGQDLVERLLALVVPAADPAHVARARAADRVQLVDEDDRRRRLLGLLEQVAHARGAHAHDRLDELRGRNGEEGGVGLARHRACQQRLAGPRRPVEQHAAWDPRAELRVALRVLQEVHDLDQLVLGLVDPGYVVEGDSVLLAGLDPPRRGAAEAAEHATPARPGLAAQQPDEERHQQDRREEAEQQRAPQRSAGVRRLGVDHDLLAGEQRRQLSGIDEGGDLGLELRDLHRLGVAGRVVACLPLQLALDRVLLRADLLHVAGLDLVDEERLVGDPLAIRGAARDEREHEVQRQQPEQDRDELPAARDHRRLALGRGSASAGDRIDPLAGPLRLPGRRAFSGRVGQVAHCTPTAPKSKACGFEGFGGVHVPLNANDAPVLQIEDGRRIDHKLGPALAALVFALEHNHPVAGVDELLWLDPVFIPYLVVFRLEGLNDLAEAAQDFAFLQAPDGPM